MKPGAFRFALAALVVVHHTTPVTFGSVAVFLFFVLSGYVIASVWQARYSRMPDALWRFAASRLWRLYPAFALSILFAAYMAGKPVAWTDLLLIGSTGHALNPPAWSLDVEAQFYLLAPLLVAAIALPSGAAFLLAVSAVFFLAFYVVGSAPNLVLPYLPFFALGMVAAVTRYRVEGRAAAFSAAAAVTLVAATYAIEPMRHFFFERVAILPHTLWASSAVAFVAVPFALWTAQQRGGTVDRALAGLSYPLYLVHWPVAYNSELVYALAWREWTLAYGPAPVAWCLCLIAAVILYAVEAPSEWLRRRVIYGPRHEPRGVPERAQ